MLAEGRWNQGALLIPRTNSAQQLRSACGREASAWRRAVDRLASPAALFRSLVEHSQPETAPAVDSPLPAPARLSATALETLAVIAYRQPVLRSTIEGIRGVNCGEILRQLMERDLVRIGGRSEELGRPYLYATTKRFLELFGLNTIDELPRGQELRANVLPAPGPVNEQQTAYPPRIRPQK